MATSNGRVSQQEQKEFDKFLKFLALKAIQVIVQSRLGDKVHSNSKPQSVGYDWFNLAISDIPEVAAQAKKDLGKKLPTIACPMCVEVSLKTSEGESMVLETWCLGLNERQDSQAKITYTVYNRMGLLLKSLTCVTRVTPAYRLSRKQGTDFIICYRVYLGDVRVSDLGDGFQSVRVGSIGTPLGTITLSAAYRTKLEIPERQSVILKSDHFGWQDTTSPPPSGIDDPLPCVVGGRGTVDMTPEFRHHIAEEIASAAETEVTASMMSPATFFPSGEGAQTALSSGTRGSFRKKSSERIPVQETSSLKSPHQPVGMIQSFSKGAFANSPEMPNLPALSSTPPFASLLREKESLTPTPLGSPSDSSRTNSTSSQKKDSSTELAENKSPPNVTTQAHAPSILGADDDFVMVELKPAFASPSCGNGELGSFYRECQTAPSLELFSDLPLTSIDNVVEALNSELDSFQGDVFQFDELVSTLQQSQTS